MQHDVGGFVAQDLLEGGRGRRRRVDEGPFDAAVDGREASIALVVPRSDPVERVGFGGKGEKADAGVFHHPPVTGAGEHPHLPAAPLQLPCHDEERPDMTHGGHAAQQGGGSHLGPFEDERPRARRG
ncbi:hypothetical protein GCM10017591_05830 [Microbacterium dextranolyticum]|uniref:Uncharacterized protein n=1 Tax=Microbacterium dextranolyticum TaxID=36806 RepID=A0A9W6HJU3_9MICO|nr:hypothetical protein GCM10017591_05830 [Microbacterium dextranolyticum]